MTVRVPLTQGKVALIDDGDAERVLALKWSLHIVPNAKTLHARHAWVEDGKWRAVKLHRFILGLGPGDPHVYHWDGDGLNNQRANLRIATVQQNRWNAPARSETGFKGVSATRHGAFAAYIPLANGNARYLGTYDTAEEAARVYDAAAVTLRGDFAWTNFPEADDAAMARARAILSGDVSALPRRKTAMQRLTNDDVCEIRRRYMTGDVYQQDLAAEYGVTVGAIQHAISGRSFKHIHDPAPITIDMRTIRNRERSTA